MNKYLCAVIGAMFTILFAIGTWWVSRVEKNIGVTEQLAFKDHYLNGNIAAAPVATPVPTPAPPK